MKKSPTKSDYIPPSERESLRDVVPTPQDDPKTSLVAIDYEPLFAEIHSYFRTFYLNEEYSERAFDLTTEVIECNPANYTAWWFRRKCLQEAFPNRKYHEEVLQEELDGFCKEWLARSSKNYQVWYHRKWLIEQLNVLPRGELQLMSDLLADDDHKIYNVWSHRLFLVKTFCSKSKEKLVGELGYTTEMLRRDVYNNSAWNHRYTIQGMLRQLLGIDLQSQERKALDTAEEHAIIELLFVKDRLLEADDNEAAWNYLLALTEVDYKWLLEPFYDGGAETSAKSRDPVVGKFLAKDIVDCFRQKDKENKHAIKFEAFLYVTLSRVAKARKQELESRLTKGLARASEHFEELRKADPIRQNFWMWKKDYLKKEFGQDMAVAGS